MLYLLTLPPIKANTKYNNPKCFSKNKFSKDNPTRSDKDCKLGVHTANNEDADKNYEKNRRNTRTMKALSCGNPLCEAGLAMHKYGKQYLKGFYKTKILLPI